MARQWRNLCVLALFLVISVLLPTAKADNKTWPTANQNLSPIQAWESTEYCLKNTSSSCEDTFSYSLNNSGWLNVTRDQGPKFCESGGCADHTRIVLICLDEVMKDYKFVNNATVKDLNDTITTGCAQGFTGVSKYRTSHGLKLNSVPIFTAVTIAVLMLISLL